MPRQLQQGNAVAVTGLFVSIFGVMFCWFPILGLFSVPVSAFALLLSLIGLLLSSKRLGARQAEAVTGVCISLLALFVAFSIHGMIGRR